MAGYLEAADGDRRQRLAGLALVLLLHLGLLLIFLTLAPPMLREKVAEMVTVRLVDVADAPEPAVPAEVAPAAETRPAERPPEVEVPEPAPPSPEVVEAPPVVVPPVPAPAVAPPPPPAAPARPARVYGPPDLRPPPPPDSERVEGSGPNGEPLYAARWYREPYDDELRGYLSTARGPGWGLIACRTVPDYRVEDCVIVGEWPPNSGMGRAVQAAAWQFRVRPPRIGGRDQVGEWVRIRITLEAAGGGAR